MEMMKQLEMIGDHIEMQLFGGFLDLYPPPDVWLMIYANNVEI